MWFYRRRNSLYPREMSITFGNNRMRVGADGRILSEVGEELEALFRQHPRLFNFQESATVAPPTENVEAPEQKVDTVKVRRARKRRKQTDEG